STPWARGAGVRGHDAATAASVRMAIRRPALVRLTSLPRRRGVVGELQPDGQHGFCEVGGERREWVRLGHRANRRLVVIRVAGGLVHADAAQASVAGDLEDDRGLLTRQRVAIPALLD